LFDDRKVSGRRLAGSIQPGQAVPGGLGGGLADRADWPTVYRGLGI